MRSASKLYVNLVVAIVLVSVFAGALVLIKPVSAATTSATWDPSLGWDFESHTDTHPSFTGISTNTPPLTDAQIIAQLQAVNTAFEEHGYPPPQHLAYPYGDYDAHVEAVVSKYVKSARTVSDNMTTFPVPDWYALNAAQLVSTTTWSDVTGWVSECISQKALLVIFTHDVSSNPSEYGCTPQMLTRILDYLVQEQNAGNLTVMTMAQAYDYWSTAKGGKPTVVMCFDDANESDYLVVYPLFVARGLKGTSYIVTSYIDEQDQLSWAEIAKMRAPRNTYGLHLESMQNSGATVNLGAINAHNHLPTDVSAAAGKYQVTFYAASGYVFDHWETTSGVTVANPTSNPATITITGTGTLKAIYKAQSPVYALHLESMQNSGATVNLGAINAHNHLPTDVSAAAGKYQVTFYAASGYVFDHWETTSGVTVANPTSNPATITITGTGTLKAIYKAQT